MSLNNLANYLSALGRREAALEAAEEAVRLYREVARTRPGAFTPDLAMSLSSLATTLSALGRREAALEAAEEAVRLYRELARTRPDAFTPELAVAFAVRANCLEALGQLEAALADNQEAIAELRPTFLHVPQAMMQWMVPMCRQYLERCKKLDLTPDEQLLAPIEEAFGRLEEE